MTAADYYICPWMPGPWLPRWLPIGSGVPSRYWLETLGRACSTGTDACIIARFAFCLAPPSPHSAFPLLGDRCILPRAVEHGSPHLSCFSSLRGAEGPIQPPYRAHGGTSVCIYGTHLYEGVGYLIDRHAQQPNAGAWVCTSS